MIKVEDYAKEIINRRGLTQKEVLEKMKKYKLAPEKTLVKQKLNNALNIKMGYSWARRIEIALELPEYILVNMVGKPTKAQWEKIKEIKKGD